MKKIKYYVVDAAARKTLGSFTSFKTAKAFQIVNGLAGVTQIWSYDPNTLRQKSKDND